MKEIPLYIDTDMGVDDIVALCMLKQSDRFMIRGISLVNGVATVQNGYQNISRILKALDLNCPVFIGNNQKEQGSSVQFPPLDRARANSLALLEKVNLPEEIKNRPLSLDDLTTQIQNESQPITLLAIGPLTNIPALISKPEVRKNIAQLYIMGGAIDCQGNVAPRFVGEYNIWLDPAAAQFVFASRIPMTLVPMDATRYVPARVDSASEAIRPMTIKFFDIIGQLTPRSAAAQIIKAVIEKNEDDFNFFYDPLVAAIMIDLSLVEKQRVVSLNVQTRGDDIGKITTNLKEGTIIAITSVDAQKFYGMLLSFIEKERNV